MKDGMKLMKIGSIIKMVLGLIWIQEPVIGPLILLSGVLLYFLTNEYEKIIEKKFWIYFLSIISFPDLIGSILIWIGLSNYQKDYVVSNPKNAPPKVVYVVDKETRKIDILLKLGVGMVFVSSLLFATTSWSFISNIVKVIALVIFGILFLVLSGITESKFKLYKSSYIYWLLSMSLFTLAIVAILYFHLFGRFLSFQGLGYNLAYMITFLTGSAFTIITYLKYPKKYLLWIAYTGIIISIISLFSHVELTTMMIICALSIIALLTNVLISKKTTLFEFSKVLTYILCIFSLATKGEALETSITRLINIVSINYLYLLSLKKTDSFIYMILTYILITYGLLSFQKAGVIVLFIVALVSSLYTILMNARIIPVEENNRKMNYALYSLVVAYTFFNTILVSPNKLGFYQIGITILYFIVNLMTKYGLCNIKKLPITKKIEPLSIFTIVFSIVNLLLKNNVALYAYIASSIVFCILSFIRKDQEENNYNEWAIIITSFLALLVNNNQLISFLLTIITSLIVFTKVMEKEDRKIKNIFSYVLLLSSLYIPFICFNTLKMELIVIVILFIIVIGLITYFLNDSLITRISYIFITLPIISLIGEYNINPMIEDMLFSILLLYVTFIIIQFYVKKPLVKNILGIIGIILSISIVFFTESLITGIYVGIIGIIIIAFGYKKEELFPIFIAGIILTIINILYRLKEVWKVIPFWLYLLIGGLAIIGFVLYKEIKKETNNKK